jgi:hypothetical protein
VQYHILTDGQHEMLQTKYGLTGSDPYRFLIYEREFPLSENLNAALLDEGHQPSVIDRHHEGASCKLKAAS